MRIILAVYEQEHSELQEKYACLQETVSEQEIGLVEMGRQLSMYVVEIQINFIVMVVVLVLNRR